MPTAKRCTPSAPTTPLAALALHTPPAVNCAQSASGATTRSTPLGLLGFAAGHSCSPSEGGTERAPLGAQVTFDADAGADADAAAATLPAGHEGHVPEQALELRPACAPKVPAGHSVQAAAPAADEYVHG